MFSHQDYKINALMKHSWEPEQLSNPTLYH